MDGVLGYVDTTHVAPKTEIRSHGCWPARKLCPGQMIRFKSANCANEVVMQIEKVHRMEKMVLVSGQVANDVAFGISEMVELVSIQEVPGNAG